MPNRHGRLHRNKARVMNESRLTDESLPDQVALMCRLTYMPAAATGPGAAIVTFAMGHSVSLRGRILWVAALGIVSAARACACH
jgi:hypothetical protein